MVAMSIGFGFFWNFCNPAQTQEGNKCDNETISTDAAGCRPCGTFTNWLGKSFEILFFLFFDRL